MVWASIKALVLPQQCGCGEHIDVRICIRAAVAKYLHIKTPNFVYYRKPEFSGQKAQTVWRDRWIHSSTA